MLSISRTCSKFFTIVLMLGSLLYSPNAFPAQAPSLASGLAPNQELALKAYKKRPQTQLSKLIYLLDLYKGSPCSVVYEGIEYQSNKALKQAKNYLSRHYRGQPAEEWLRANAYRSLGNGMVIYFRSPDGKQVPLRDVLLIELEKLQKNPS